MSGLWGRRSVDAIMAKRLRRRERKGTQGSLSRSRRAAGHLREESTEGTVRLSRCCGRMACSLCVGEVPARLRLTCAEGGEVRGGDNGLRQLDMRACVVRHASLFFVFCLFVLLEFAQSQAGKGGSGSGWRVGSKTSDWGKSGQLAAGVWGKPRCSYYTNITALPCNLCTLLA